VLWKRCHHLRTSRCVDRSSIEQIAISNSNKSFNSQKNEEEAISTAFSPTSAIQSLRPPGSKSSGLAFSRPRSGLDAVLFSLIVWVPIRHRVDMDLTSNSRESPHHQRSMSNRQTPIRSRLPFPPRLKFRLRVLDLDGNPIRSSKGCQLSMRNCNLQSRPYFRRLCVVAFGFPAHP
jgi:hypothetical protein